MEPRDVFVSYVEEDSNRVLLVGGALRSLGFSTWTFEEDSVPGLSYLEQVYEAVIACRAFLLMASKISVRSHQIIKEVELAHAEQRAVIPVLIDLTVHELRSSSVVLKMAIGTTVPLNAGLSSPDELAARIQTTLAHLDITAQNPASASWRALVEGHLRALDDARIVDMKCLSCNGTGKWASVQKPGKWNTCKKCNGTGVQKGPYSLKQSLFGSEDP